MQIMIVLMVFNHLITTTYLSGWRKYAKLGQFYRKKGKILILDDFFEFECLNMLDNADYDSTNGSFSFDYHKLPGLRAELCKIRLIMWKKSQNIDF